MSYLSEQNTDTPLSRWQFEEPSGTVIDDDITVTRDGTINGGVTLAQAAVFMDGGLGADFNGTTGYVSFGNASGLLGIGTVEVVAMFDTIPATNRTPIFQHNWTTGQVMPMVLGFNLDSAHPAQLQVGYYTGSAWMLATWADSPRPGVAYHLVGTYNGTILKFYANGVEVGSTTPGTARPAGTVNATAFIGARYDLTAFLDGRIWDVAIYAGALSGARANDHFRALANPFSDSFAGALPAPLYATISGVDTTAWTTEVSEPGGMDRTGWATFTPATTGIYVLSTVGSSFDTLLAVYTGTALNNLVLVVADDNSGGAGTSAISTVLTAATTYYIQVGAQVAGAGGLLTFSLDKRPDSRLAALSVESLTDSGSVPVRRLAAVSLEAITDSASIPQRRLGGLTVEVLTPATLVFIGWGTPL